MEESTEKNLSFRQERQQRGRNKSVCTGCCTTAAQEEARAAGTGSWKQPGGKERKGKQKAVCSRCQTAHDSSAPLIQTGGTKPWDFQTFSRPFSWSLSISRSSQRQNHYNTYPCCSLLSLAQFLLSAAFAARSFTGKQHVAWNIFWSALNYPAFSKMKGRFASLTRGRERLQTNSPEFSKLVPNWRERDACTPLNLCSLSMQPCANCKQSHLLTTHLLLR